jgi:hypothetical protein
MKRHNRAKNHRVLAPPTTIDRAPTNKERTTFKSNSCASQPNNCCRCCHCCAADGKSPLRPRTASHRVASQHNSPRIASHSAIHIIPSLISLSLLWRCCGLAVALLSWRCCFNFQAVGEDDLDALCGIVRRDEHRGEQRKYSAPAMSEAGEGSRNCGGSSW